jgi:hypothetical protein
MIPKKHLQISFKESSLKDKQIISQQPEISFAEALAQVQRLKKLRTAIRNQRKAGRIADAIY